MRALPTVTTVMPVYNGEEFLAEALESALGQDYPAERLEVVVVDDGSTDGTAALLEEFAARTPERLRVARQPNGGNVSAVNRAIELARGDLIALLDADDVWPPDKTRRQAAFLRRNPGVGLVYGNMRVIDDRGRVVQDSWLAGEDPPHGERCAARFLTGNCATASSIVFRSALLGQIAPIPGDVPFADWWFAARAAELGAIGYMPEPRTLYRFHGKNMTLGTQGRERQRELLKSMTLQRRLLRCVDLDSGSPAELQLAWEAFERNAAEVLELAASPFATLLSVTEDDRSGARRLAADAEAALDRGAAPTALARFVNAAATDPWLESARQGMADAIVVLRDDPEVPGQRPLGDARRFVVLAFADELAASPPLLRSYFERMTGLDATLAIDATAMAPETAERTLQALVSDVGDRSASVDTVAVLGPLDAVGRARLAGGVHAVWSDRRPLGHEAPWFAAAELEALRTLALAAGA